MLRDVTEAQDALLEARNALSAAAVDYRLAELDFMRDTGVLKIDNTGLVTTPDLKRSKHGE